MGQIRLKLLEHILIALTEALLLKLLLTLLKKDIDINARHTVLCSVYGFLSPKSVKTYFLCTVISACTSVQTSELLFLNSLWFMLTKVFIIAHLPAYKQKIAMFWQKLKCTSQLTDTVVTFANRKHKKIWTKQGVSMTVHVIRTVPQCDVLKIFVAFPVWFINIFTWI